MLLIVAALLLVRFYFAPHIDQWRPELQAWVQSEVHSGLNFDEVKIQWQGLEPELVLDGVKLLKQDASSEGTIQNMRIKMDWWRLFSGRAKVHELSLEAAQLTFRRDQQGYVRLADEVILYNPYEAATAPNALPLNRDLQAQEQRIKQQLQQVVNLLPNKVRLRNSQLIWLDEQRQSPELVLDQINLQLDQRLTGLSLQASSIPPVNLAGPVKIQADLNYQGQGKAELHFENFFPQTLRHWLDLPVLISQGYMEQGTLYVAYERGEISQFDWHSQWRNFILHEQQGEQALDVQLDALDLQVSSLNGLSLPYQIKLSASNLNVQATEFFRHPIALFGVQAEGQYLETSEQLARIELSQLRVRLPSGSIQGHGSWQVDPYSDNGLLDLQAKIDFLDLADLPHYLPKAIAADSLNWLEKAFQGGRIENAQLAIKGVVDHIPYGRRPNSGEFHIQGEVRDVVLNYHQRPDRGGKYWPKLIAPHAQIDFLADNIQVTAQQAQLEGAESVALSDLHAHIAHIEKDTEVSIKAQVAASGQEFLNFYQISPLQRILRGALNQSQITGQLQGQIALQIPITHVDDTTVNGQLNVNQASFQFEPIYPVLTQAKGTLLVSEKNLQVKELHGKMLGGPVSVQGVIGGAGDSLSLSGELSGQGLREFLPLKGLQRVEGRTAYTAQLDFLGQERMNFSMSSSLKGLALKLPGALNKTAAQTQPLRVQWLDKRPQGTRQLLVDYANQQVRAVFERVDKRSSFFHRGVIAINRSAQLPSKGLAVLIQGGDWDLVQWQDLIDEFGESTAQANRQTRTKSSSQATFPSLQQLDLQMDRMDYHILHVDNIQLLGDRIDNKNWSLQLRSADIQGKLNVRLSDDLKQLHALSGTYDHVHWREANTTQVDGSVKNSTHRVSATDTTRTKPLDLPNIDLKINRFSLYGHELGALKVKGTNQSKKAWQLNELSLYNEVGSLYATGGLQTQDSATAADIRLNINALDMGKFLSHFGLADRMTGGSGFVNGQIRVPDVRRATLNTLQANWEAQVTQGSLLSVNSQAVKALEFISLQSLSRLSQVGDGHRLFGEGLQFDYVRGQFALKQQALHVADFRLDGPLVAVVAMGDTNLRTTQLDFQAVAVPKIEMSGAAILSGIIVNPVVGVGAFLTQWLLQEPLARALTQYFHVTGTWDEPKLNDVALPSEEQLKEKDAQRKMDEFYRN